MRKVGLIISAGWPKLQPGATRARTPGMAALAGSDCFPLSGLPQLSLLPFHGECGLADASCRATRHGLWRWDRLTRFTTNGRLEMTHNAAERAIQPRALGRKTWLFAGSDTGGERAAMIYTIIETAKLSGPDVYTYLAELFDRIGAHPINRVAELLPWNWSQGLYKAGPLDHATVS
jgi:Transposase IS66 family/IS66 C-terminal element